MSGASLADKPLNASQCDRRAERDRLAERKPARAAAPEVWPVRRMRCPARRTAAPSLEARASTSKCQLAAASPRAAARSHAPESNVVRGTAASAMAPARWAASVAAKHDQSAAITPTRKSSPAGVSPSPRPASRAAPRPQPARSPAAAADCSAAAGSKADCHKRAKAEGADAGARVVHAHRCARNEGRCRCQVESRRRNCCQGGRGCHRVALPHSTTSDPTTNPESRRVTGVCTSTNLANESGPPTAGATTTVKGALPAAAVTSERTSPFSLARLQALSKTCKTRAAVLVCSQRCAAGAREVALRSGGCKIASKTQKVGGHTKSRGHVQRTLDTEHRQVKYPVA